MTLAVLFWFYKEPNVCANRLQLIKKYNPNIKIFGLYGGARSQANIYRNKLGKYLDNFFITSLQYQSKRWKWLNGDLMLLDWYKKRGRVLKWDSIIVIQWDALVLGDIRQQFVGLNKGQIFLSGLRTLDSSIESRWNWTKLGSKERKRYLDFKKYIKDRYDYISKLLCCLFILQILPRRFFIEYISVNKKSIGMLEYKVPTYAKIFSVPFYKKNLGVWWFNKKAYQGLTPLNARGKEIKKIFISKQLRQKNGYRIFHPYFKLWNG